LDVINRVHTLARRSNANKSLLFTNRHGGAINDSGDDEDNNKHYTEDNDDDDDNDNFVPGVDQDNDNNDRDPDNNSLNGLDGDDDDNLAPTAGVQQYNNDNDDNVNNDDIPLAGVDDGDDRDIAGVTDDADTPANDEDTNKYDSNDDENNAERAGVRFATTTKDEEGNKEDIETIEQKYGKRTTAHNLRPRKPRDYGHMHITLEHTCMTQHSVKKGLKNFGKAGSDAVIAEMQQLHDRDVIKPKKANLLTQGEKRLYTTSCS
jgi:hypothetical protein